MPTVSARYLITGALKDLKILDPVQTLKAPDAEDGFDKLNDMVDAWVNENLYVMTSVKATATFSGQSATIGPGGDFDVPLPVRVNHAFYRRGDEDRELSVVDAAGYDRIALKSLSDDLPQLIRFQRTVPLGTIFVWPVPGTTTYLLDVDQQLQQFADLDTVYEVGQGYRQALRYALAEQLATLYEKPIQPDLAKAIKRSKRVLKRSNLVVPSMTIETPFTGGRYADVVSGTFPYP